MLDSFRIQEYSDSLLILHCDQNLVQQIQYGYADLSLFRPTAMRAISWYARFGIQRYLKRAIPDNAWPSVVRVSRPLIS